MPSPRFPFSIPSAPVDLAGMWTDLGKFALSEWQRLHRANPALPEQIGDTRVDGLLFTLLRYGPDDLGYFIERGGPNLGSELIQELIFAGQWAQFGFPVFQLTHTMLSSLILTDAGSVRAEDLRFPYPAFLIELPQPHCPLSFWDADGAARKPVKYIRFMTYRNARNRPFGDDNEAMISLLNEMAVLFRQGKAYEAAGKYATFRQAYSWDASTSLELYAENGINVYVRDRMPAPDQRLEDWLSAKVPDVSVLSMYDGDRVAQMAGLRVVANMCLYITEQRRLGKEGENTTPQPQKVKSGKTKPNIVTLGRTLKIKLPHLIREAARDFVERGESQEKRVRWRLTSKFPVIGHFHAYWHGAHDDPQRHKRIHWVAPYLKGQGPDVSRVYEVDEVPPNWEDK